MNPEELARYRALADQNRKLRRRCEELEAENERLRKGQNEASRAFDEENKELFLVVRRNHEARTIVDRMARQ